MKLRVIAIFTGKSRENLNTTKKNAAFFTKVKIIFTKNSQKSFISPFLFVKHFNC